MMHALMQQSIANGGKVGKAQPAAGNENESRINAAALNSGICADVYGWRGATARGCINTLEGSAASVRDW